MLILTVPLKIVQDDKMIGGSYLTPDFGHLNVKSWGKCAEDAPEGFMTVWVDCVGETDLGTKSKEIIENYGINS